MMNPVKLRRVFRAGCAAFLLGAGGAAAQTAFLGGQYSLGLVGDYDGKDVTVTVDDQIVVDGIQHVLLEGMVETYPVEAVSPYIHVRVVIDGVGVAENTVDMTGAQKLILVIRGNFVDVGVE